MGNSKERLVDTHPVSPDKCTSSHAHSFLLGPQVINNITGDRVMGAWSLGAGIHDQEGHVSMHEFVVEFAQGPGEVM